MEEPQSFRNETFDKTGTEAKTAEVEEGSLKNLVKAIEASSNSGDKIHSEASGLPADDVGELQSTHSGEEKLIPDDTLSRETEVKQQAESHPTLNETNISAADSENPIETTLESLVEQDEQNNVNSVAKDEVDKTQSKEIGNVSSAAMVDIKDDITEHKDDSSTEIVDIKQEDIETDKKTSPPEVEDHVKADENMATSSLSIQNEKVDEKLSSLARQASEEDMNIATSVGDDNSGDSNLKSKEEDLRNLNLAHQALDEDVTVATSADDDDTAETNLNKAEETQGLKSEKMGKETSPSKDVETIDSCETGLTKTEGKVASEPIELATDANLTVGEDQSSQGENLKNESLKEDEAPFDEIKIIEKAKNEDNSEGDQSVHQLEVETQANPDEEKVDITKEDKLSDVPVFLPCEEKIQAMPEKTTANDIIKANEVVLNEQNDEAAEKIFTDDKEDAEKKNIKESEGFAVETSEGGHNETEVSVSEPKPQDNLCVSDGESKVPEISQEYPNQDLEDQKSQQQGETEELNTRDENKDLVESQQLIGKTCLPNETVSLNEIIDQDVHDTSHSGSSTGGLDVPNECSPGEVIYREDTLKGSGVENSVNEVVNQKAIEHSIPEKEEPINEEASFTATASSEGHVSPGENNESVRSLEGSNKEHDEGEARTLQENIEEMTEKNAKGVIEPSTTDDDQSIHLQNEASIAEDSLTEEIKNEQMVKSLPLAPNVHTKSVTDLDNPTEPILETSVEEDKQSREFSGAIVVDSINELGERSEHSGTLVAETVDGDTEKNEDFSDQISDDKIPSQTHVETILSETKEQHDQPKFDENEGTVKSEDEEKDDKLSNVTTEGLEESITNVTTAAKIEEASPEESYSNEWNERTLALEEQAKEKVKDEEASATIIDDQHNEAPESDTLAEAREDAAKEIEENIIDKKQLEGDNKLNSEDKLESVDAKVNETEKDGSVASSPTDERNYGESSETLEKNIMSKEDQRMSMLDGKTINDDFHVKASKPQNEAFNTFPLEQDLTTATTELTESSYLADEEKSELIPKTIETKEDMAMEKIGEQCETEPKEQIHEDSSNEKYPIAEVQEEKKFPNEIVQREIPLQVSEGEQELTTRAPIGHTEEVDSVDESIRHPTSADAEKEVPIDAVEISDYKHNEQTQDDGYQYDDQLTLESGDGIEDQGAVENNINVELSKDESLGNPTLENIHIEDASTSNQEPKEMKEVYSKSDPQESTFQAEEPAGNKEPLGQDDEISVKAYIDQSAEIQKPDEVDNKKGLDNNLVQGEQAEPVPQEGESSDDVMVSAEATEEALQFQDTDNGTNKFDPSKVEQDPRATRLVSEVINNAKDSDGESQHTSAVGDENHTIREVAGKHDEIQMVQSTEGHEFESVEEGGYQEQPTNVNKVIGGTEAKLEEITEPYSTKAEETLKESKEDQDQATMILQGVATDERIPDTLVTDREEKEHDSPAVTSQTSDNVFSSKDDKVSQDAGDRTNTITDPDEKQNNETKSIEVIESNNVETSIEGYPEEQHDTDATEETGEKESTGHNELIEDHLVEKQQSNDADIETGGSGSVGYELTADHSVEKGQDDEVSTDKQEALSTETEENLSKQTLPIEEMKDIATSHSVTEDKQLPEQTIEEIKVLNMEEKEPNPFADSSDTTMVDETCSIGYEDEKHHPEEHPIELTKGSEDKANDSVEQPIQASEATIDPRESGSIICEVPEYHLVQKREALKKQTTASEARQSHEASSPIQEFEDQKPPGQVADVKTRLDEDVKLIKTSSDNVVEDFTNNKEDEDGKGDLAEVEEIGTLEAQEETKVKGYSEEDKINASEVLTDAGNRDSPRDEEINQLLSIRPEELVEPSIEKKQNLGEQTSSTEVECIQEAPAQQIITEDEQLRGQTIDDTEELNTQEKEQNPIPTSLDTATKGTFTGNEDEEKKGELDAVDGTGYIADEDEKHSDEELPIKLKKSNENDAVLEGKHEEHASEVTMEGGESDSVSYEEAPDHPFIEEDGTLNKQKTTPEETDTQEKGKHEEQKHASEVTMDGGESDSVSYEEAPEHPFIEEDGTLNKEKTTPEETDAQETSSQKRVIDDLQLEGHATDDNVKKKVNALAMTSEVALEDLAGKEENDDNKGADGAGLMGVGDENQSTILTETNEHETIVEGSPKEEQIHASNVSLDAGESGSRSYDDLAQHPSMETKHASSKQLAEVDGTGYMADEDEKLSDEDQPIKLTETNENGAVVEGKHEEQHKHASEVAMEGGQSGSEQNAITMASETALEDFTDEKENKDNKGVDGPDLRGVEDEKQSILLPETNEDETKVESCPEEEQIDASDVSLDAGERVSRSYDELGQYPSIATQQASGKQLTEVDVMNSQETLIGDKATEDQHVTEVTSELGQGENEPNLVAAKAKATLADSVSEKEDGENKDKSVEENTIETMGDEDDKNGDKEQSIKLAETNLDGTIAENHPQDKQGCASDSTQEAGDIGLVRDEEFINHQADIEQAPSESTNSQDAHTLERATEDLQPVEGITDDATELDKAEKEQIYNITSSETALRSFSNKEDEEREEATAAADDIGSMGDEVERSDDKESKTSTERYIPGTTAETNQAKHTEGPNEVTRLEGNVDPFAREDTESHLREKESLDEPIVAFTITQDILEKKEAGINVSNDEGECTGTEHLQVKNDNQMLDGDVKFDLPEKVELNFNKNDKQAYEGENASMQGEHKGEREDQEDKDFVLSRRETSIEPIAATNEAESCMIQESGIQGISQHPVENEAGSSKEIAPRDVIEQEEIAPNSEAHEEITLHSKLQDDETKDASGNDGLHIIKDEVPSGSHIQNIAHEEILEEPELPGISDVTEEMEAAESSNIHLSPEDNLNDADHSEPDKKGSDDACDQLNPDKTVEEEIKDSATKPIDIVDTTSTSDTTKQEGLTKDEDDQIKTIDEPTDVTTSPPVKASDEELSGLGKNELVEEKVKEIIEISKEDEASNIDPSLDEPSFKGDFQDTASDIEQPQEQSAIQEVSHREMPPLEKWKDENVYGEAAKSHFPEPELKSDSPSENKSIDLQGEKEIDEVANRSESSNLLDETNFDASTNADEIRTTILDSLHPKHEPTSQVPGTMEHNDISREISTDEEKHDKDSASLLEEKNSIDEDAGVNKELNSKVENNEDSATEQIDKGVETTSTLDALQKEYFTKDEDGAVKIKDEPTTATTSPPVKTSEEEATGFSKNELVQEEVKEVIELPKEDNSLNFDPSLDKSSFEGGGFQVTENDLENPKEESTNVEASPREVPPMERWKDETVLGEAATPNVLDPNSKQNEDLSTENKSIESKEELDLNDVEVQEGEKNEVAKVSERNLDTITNADEIRAEIEKARIFDSSLEAVNTKHEPTFQVPVTTEQNDLSREISVDDEKNTNDSAGFPEEGNFKDEDDGLKKEIDSKEENSEVSNDNLESRETQIVHAEDIEDNEKVGKVEEALAAEAKVDGATFADKTCTETHISEETKPKEDESSLISVWGPAQIEKVKDGEEAEIVDKDIKPKETNSTQAQEAEEAVAEEKVDEPALASGASLESPKIETSVSDGLPEASRLQCDDASSIVDHATIQDGSKKEEELVGIIEEEQPQLRVENADTSSYNIESGTLAVHSIETAKEKEVKENLQEASQRESEMSSHENLGVDETKSESTTAESNGSDDFVHVGKPEDEENGSFSGSLSPQDEPMEPTDKSTTTTSEVLVQEPVPEDKNEDVQKDEKLDINAGNANSEASNEDTKSLLAGEMESKQETAYTDKGWSGLSPPVEELNWVVSNEESKTKDEQCSSTPNPETNETTDLTRQLQEEESVKNGSAVIAEEEKIKKEKDEEGSVVHDEKVEEETSAAYYDSITVDKTSEEEAQGIPHSIDEQMKITDENVGKLNPDPASVTSDARETSLTAKDDEENKVRADADVEEKTDEEKEHEHREEEPGLDAPVMVETSREANIKPSPKKSHNILSGVGSKVKHSISKVKKAITGKSSPSKSPAHKSG